MLPTITMTLNGHTRVYEVMTGLQQRDPVMLRGIGTLAVRSVKRDIRAQRSPDGTAYRAVNRFGHAGQRMIDTARLINSIHFEISGMSVFVGTNVDYAKAQNFGGTWGPKRAKMLARPMTRAVARAYIAGKSLRVQYPTAFILKARTGNLFLARKIEGKPIGFPLKSINLETGKRSRAKATTELLYQLVDTTTIYGTHFLDRLSDQGEEDIRFYIQKRIAARMGIGMARASIDVTTETE